ncbi:hypothetical protein K1T71_002326 [Dendrolimus kikuchii]|uniref:Uncharacterized protein n=1 Tax=Dendrolimus kikuchii TaxID=765133 RepID=A0ACC1DCD4_9NEOP|nr:hypothetical protein K1T71_002326 [Dendrolimus kikuchii]
MLYFLEFSRQIETPRLKPLKLTKAPRSYSSVMNSIIRKKTYSIHAVLIKTSYACVTGYKIYPNDALFFMPTPQSNWREVMYVCMQSERGNCQDLHSSHEAHKNIVDMTFCYNCEGDRCNVNAVTQSLPSWTIGVLVLIVTPLLGKHTLS